MIMLSKEKKEKSKPLTLEPQNLHAKTMAWLAVHTPPEQTYKQQTA